jgi:hypothetical protein
MHITPPEGALALLFGELHAELGGRGVDELTMQARPVDAFRSLRIRRQCLTVAGQRDGQVTNPLRVGGADPVKVGTARSL